MSNDKWLNVKETNFVEGLIEAARRDIIEDKKIEGVYIPEEQRKNSAEYKTGSNTHFNEFLGDFEGKISPSVRFNKDALKEDYKKLKDQIFKEEIFTVGKTFSEQLETIINKFVKYFQELYSNHELEKPKDRHLGNLKAEMLKRIQSDDKLQGDLLQDGLRDNQVKNVNKILNNERSIAKRPKWISEEDYDDGRPNKDRDNPRKNQDKVVKKQEKNKQTGWGLGVF